LAAELEDEHVRIAVLMTGLTAYQDKCFSELAALGNELLLVHPSAMAYAAFDPAAFSGSVERYVWDRTDSSPNGETTSGIPAPDVLVPVIEKFAPDVVIMWSWSGKGYRAVMKKFRDRALRVVFTSNFWHGSKKQYAGLLAGPFYVVPLFDAAFVPGERSELFARRIGFKGRQIIRGGNSADTDLFERGPREQDEIASRKRFLFTGRLIWHKAPVLLAEAYAEYRTKVDDPWELVVAGDGPERDHFKDKEGIDWRGFVQPADLVDLMHASSGFILPSHLEWYGVVVHEAVTAGLPIICSDGVGAVPHLLQDGFNGWTVAADDRDELVAAMVRMSTMTPGRLRSMSDGSRALGSRLTPKIWALNLHEQLERRVLAMRTS
jgi:glycosyltransferase involved in cell wall biosynthesis